MGNNQTSVHASRPPPNGEELLNRVKTPTELPEQFITQAFVDWRSQLKDLYCSRPTITRSVILPAGVDLSDSRLAAGTVLQEKRSILVGEDAVMKGWPDDRPFEADVDSKLLPPCKGMSGIHTHYAVYPNRCFAELQCGYCELHKQAHPQLHGEENLLLAAMNAKFSLSMIPDGSYAAGHLTDEEIAATTQLVKIPQSEVDPSTPPPARLGSDESDIKMKKEEENEEITVLTGGDSPIVSSSEEAKNEHSEEL